MRPVHGAPQLTAPHRRGLKGLSFPGVAQQHAPEAVRQAHNIRDADRVVGLLAAAEVPARLIVNRISPHLVKRGDMLSQTDVIEILALELLGAVPLDDIVIATTNKGVPAVLEGKGLAARELLRIAKKLAGHEVDDKESVGFFTRLGRALGLSATPA